MGLKILIFNLSDEKKAALQVIGRDMKIQLLEVRPVDYEQQLGYLAGVTGFQKNGRSVMTSAFPLEMLVFSGFSSDRMDQFLDKYKQTGLPAIRLKAMITPSNIFWTPKKLFGEILQEHMQMSQYNTKR